MLIIVEVSAGSMVLTGAQAMLFNHVLIVSKKVILSFWINKEEMTSVVQTERINWPHLRSFGVNLSPN